MPKNTNGMVVVGERRHAKVSCKCDSAEGKVLATVVAGEREVAPMIAYTHMGKQASEG
jgi:hypothetical protein